MAGAARGVGLVLLMLLGPVMARADGVSAACTDEMAIPWQSLAPGVWVWAPTEPAEVSPFNGGHVVPTSVFIHQTEALVIDPGPSLRHGQRLRASLACRFQARVTQIVNTHAHSENVLANAAFADEVAAGLVRIWATEGTREAMAKRCPACLESLTLHAGEAALAGTTIVLPTHTLQPGGTVQLGPHRLAVLRTEQGHTQSDALLWSPALRALWAGGLVYQGRLPELAQGSVDDWIGALERLAALRPSVVVSVGVSRAPNAEILPPALSETLAYLKDLRQGVWDAMEQGAQPQDPGLVDLPAYRHWVGHAERQGFNVLRAWRELEPLWMQAPEASPSPQPAGRAP